MKLPGWLVDALRRALPALQAEEAMAAAYVARLAWADGRDFERVQSRLQRAAEPQRTFCGPSAVVPATEAARRWFEENGIPMVEA